MGSEFKRLKRYNAAWTMIRALTFGVSACLLLLLDKLRLAQLGVIGYAGSMVAGLMAGAVAYWILRKSDLRLAEKIDRVQTMIAYQDDEGAVVQLQRQDTENRLKQVRQTCSSPLLPAATCCWKVCPVASRWCRP